MKKLISTIFLIAVFAAGIFLYLRNADVDINYERFNVVAPGVLRTPVERFNNIVDYPFRKNYLTIGDTRIHYLDRVLKMAKLSIYFMVNLLGVIYLEK